MNDSENKSPAACLESGLYIDSNNEAIQEFAKQNSRTSVDERTKALALYRVVRDEIKFDAYVDYGDRSNYRASGVLKAGRGFCIGKSALLAASCRAVGVPARVGYAKVRNHMTSRRLYERMQTDIFSWHSFTDIFIDGRWVKATPAFDKALCERIGFPPLDFSGNEDSLLQPLDPDGNTRMEYIEFRGVFDDVPIEQILDDFRVRYPKLFSQVEEDADFRHEATAKL